MPLDMFTLPTGEILQRIYGERHPTNSTTYLNAVRMGVINPEKEFAIQYHVMEKFYALRLAKEVISQVPDFDAVVSPPSSRGDALSYLEGILQKKSVPNLSHNFSRSENVRFGNNDTTLEQAVDALTYSPDGSEGEITSLIIVDESTATGKTIAAVLQHMRSAGLQRECRVTVAAWAKLGL